MKTAKTTTYQCNCVKFQTTIEAFDTKTVQPYCEENDEYIQSSVRCLLLPCILILYTLPPSLAKSSPAPYAPPAQTSTLDGSRFTSLMELNERLSINAR